MDNVRREAADRLLMAVSVTMTTCAIIEGPQQSKRQMAPHRIGSHHTAQDQS